MEILVILLGVSVSALLAQLVGAVHLAIQQYKYDRAIAKIVKRTTQIANKVAGKHKSEIGG